MIVRTILTVLLLGGYLPVAQARMLVLIHGYLGSAQDWRLAVTDTLSRDGWHDGGQLRAHMPDGGPARGDIFYTVELPSETRLPIQSAVLTTQLHELRRIHPHDPLVLVGHSAGGVVARLAMVQDPGLGVQALITIASPHLGTDTARLALLASESPLAEIASRFGIDTLNRSRALFADLIPERPGSFLYWLNRQPHPPALYISLVREAEPLPDGDLLVPASSQDLRAVAALAQRAVSFPMPGRHELTPQDGNRLLAILHTLPETAATPRPR